MSKLQARNLSFLIKTSECFSYVGQKTHNIALGFGKKAAHNVMLKKANGEKPSHHHFRLVADDKGQISGPPKPSSLGQMINFILKDKKNPKKTWLETKIIEYLVF